MSARGRPKKKQKTVEGLDPGNYLNWSVSKLGEELATHGIVAPSFPLSFMRKLYVDNVVKKLTPTVVPESHSSGRTRRSGRTQPELAHYAQHGNLCPDPTAVPPTASTARADNISAHVAARSGFIHSSMNYVYVFRLIWGTLES